MHRDGALTRSRDGRATSSICSSCRYLVVGFRGADFDEDGEGRLAAGFVGDGEGEAVGFGDPAFGAEEDFAVVLVFGNKDAVEADVIDDDAVGEVPAARSGLPDDWGNP
jgi:hypothetical protein